MSERNMRVQAARAPGTVPALVRSPLARGRRYQYAGFNSGFVVRAVACRGHPEDDGGLPGVAIRWTGFGRGGRSGGVWYLFKTEAEFWAHDLFRNAYDRPNIPITVKEARK
jgi:hypothetical protein